MKTYFILVACVGIVMNALNSEAQQIILSECLGSTENEIAHDIQPTSDGGFIIVGYTKTPVGIISATNHGAKDFWVMKLNGDGSLVWQKNYGGTLNDEAWGAAESSAGEFVIVGSTYSNDIDVTDHIGSTEHSDIWLIRINSSGQLLSSKSFGTEFEDTGVDVEIDDVGHLKVAGNVSGIGQNVEENIGLSDFWLSEMDVNGNLIWEKVYGGTSDEQMQDLLLAPNGDAYMAGISYSIGTSFLDGEAYVVKVDDNGQQFWDLDLGSTTALGTGSVGKLCLNEDGGIMVSYQTSTNMESINCNNHGAFLVAHIDSEGEIEDTWCMGGGGTDRAIASCMQSNGDHWTLGTTNSNDGDVTPPSGYQDDETNMWICKSDEDGQLLWNKSLGGTRTETAIAMFISDTGKIFLLGNTNSSNGEVEGAYDNTGATTDAWVVVIDALASGVESGTTAAAFSLYPNPVNEVLNLRFSDADLDHFYRVLDSYGQIVREEKINRQVVECTTGQLSTGIYTIQLLDAVGRPVQSTRFLKL